MFGSVFVAQMQNNVKHKNGFIFFKGSLFVTKIVFEGECVGNMVLLLLNLAREETHPPALSAVYFGALKGAQA